MDKVLMAFFVVNGKPIAYPVVFANIEIAYRELDKELTELGYRTTGVEEITKNTWTITGTDKQKNDDKHMDNSNFPKILTFSITEMDFIGE